MKEIENTSSASNRVAQESDWLLTVLASVLSVGVR